MFDRRLALRAIPVGLALGALCWLVAGRATSGAQLGAIETRLQQAQPARQSAGSATLVDLTLVAPLFATATEVVAAADPSVTVLGVTRTSRRTAALVSINGGVADWMVVGEAREGVTLQEVRSSSVVVVTANGPKDIALGQTGSGTSAPMAQAMPPQGGAGSPAGFRSPPPPASAPKTP